MRRKKQLYVLVQKLCGSFEASEGSLICRELLGLEKGEDLEEPAVRTEAYYQSRPCVKACRRAAEILEEYVKEENIRKGKRRVFRQVLDKRKQEGYERIHYDLHRKTF